MILTLRASADTLDASAIVSVVVKYRYMSDNRMWITEFFSRMLCEIGDCDFDDENDAALKLHGF